MNTSTSSCENYDFSDSFSEYRNESSPKTKLAAVPEPWKIFIIDDDDEVHKITRMVLGSLMFEERPVVFLHSYSSEQALEIFRANPDIAVALVDVVMDTDDAGLRLVEQVRSELGNSFVRLILRTGQAGLAPEREVVIRYDINDYKEKTELSSEKLCTAVISALRSYRDIIALESARLGMERMVTASEVLFRARTVFQFTEIVLSQALAVMGVSTSTALQREAKGLLVAKEGAYFVPGTICATTGSCRESSSEILASLEQDTNSFRHNQEDCVNVEDRTVEMLVRSSYGDEFQLVIQLPRPAKKVEIWLLELFRLKANSALERLVQIEKTREAQRQAIRALAKIREQHTQQDHTSAYSVRKRTDSASDLVAIAGDNICSSLQPGVDFFCQLAIQAEVTTWGNPERAAAHILRVSRYAYHLAKLYGADNEYCGAILRAARLHDIGNLFVSPYHYCAWSESDGTARSLATPHTTTGSQFLAENEQTTLSDTQLAVEIALHHHEAWDGRGYPAGLSGEKIPLSARIVAVSDFFDTATHGCAACEKPANRDDEVFEMLSMASGFLFDPKIVNLFVRNRDIFFSARNEVNQSFFITQHER